MVVGESIILGTPVLTTNYDSAEEQIKQGYNGIIVEKNVEKIYLKIKELLIDNTKIQYLKNNIDKTNFSNNKAIKQIDTIFRN